MKRLLVVADDLGLTPGVNAGIASAFHGGILTSASFLTNTSHFDATVEMFRPLAGLKIGIHLTLVGGRPVLPVSSIPSLVSGGGAFQASWRHFLPVWWAGRVRREEVRAEWRAQISRAVDAGIRPTHLDSHQHLHLLPGLWGIALDLAREFGIARIRLPRESATVPAGTPLMRRMVRRTLAGVCPNTPAAGSVRCSDHFFGISETGRLDQSALLAVLRRIPDGWSELLTHPGFPDEELLRDHPWGYRWADEVRALTSEEARGEVGRLGIVLEKG